MRAASALSTHPVAASALGECAGQVIETLDARPALVLVAVTPPHLGTLDDIGAALAALLESDVVVGAVASAVAGGGRQVAGDPALAMFAVTDVAASPLLLIPGDGRALTRHGNPGGASAALVLADPFSCAGPALLGGLRGVEACGGILDAARGRGGSRLLLDGVVHTAGAVGALLGPPARALASQGGTPVGPTWAVTRAEGDVVLELGGRPAVERRIESLGDDGRPRAAALGVVLDEHDEHPGRGVLRVIRLLGPSGRGGLLLERAVEVGRVVRFVRLGEADTEGDLVTALAHSGRAVALLFPGPGRSGDVDLLTELLGATVAGVSVGAALAPLVGETALHGPETTGVLRLGDIGPERARSS